MVSKTLHIWDTLLGWIVFSIALIVYGLTMEPTVSFWDSGEYISTSAKLQIAHPPGAPLLQMIGAFFAMFVTDETQVALMVNYVSVVSSAFTVLLLFWTITNLARKLVVEKEEIPMGKSIAILGSGMVGALSYTFSDSFWFNATETEVYAMASLIMALLLWLGLKWTDNLYTPRGDKWLLLVSFVVGLTFGIQFMGFLAIPSVGLLYFFKCCKTVTLKRFILANAVSVIILLVVFKLSLTYVFKIFGWSEIFFVNTFGLPFNSGTVIMGLFFGLFFYLTLRYTRRKKYYKANTAVLSLLFLVIGFSSWLMLPIRANAKVVINENDPSDARALLAYYNREQYPSPESPFYGAYYSNSFAYNYPDKDDRPKYEKDLANGKYVVVNHYKKALRGSSKEHTGILPRMWSEQHKENYIRYYGTLDFTIKPEFQNNPELREIVRDFRKRYAEGTIETDQYLRFLEEMDQWISVEPPTLWQNIKYLFHFQWGYMYWRYFMWNFVGKLNDEQGKFDGNGEWISGIKVLDSLRLGRQDSLPKEDLDNKGRNTYFFLPLLLGIIGLIFQLSKGPKQFWVLFVFFLFTGIAIQFYTNPVIFQPRERDYSLIGSFYAFAIWIGIGVFGLYKEIGKFLQPKIGLPLVLGLCLVMVPIVMAQQNWDDHDRSDRYTALAMAKAYLDSTQKNTGAILFTIGDMDTFPLWYVQEIEGYRTDTRVIISGYLNFPWYIDQMKRRAYENGPIPSQLSHDTYKYGSRDIIYHAPLMDKRWSIQDFMKWVGSDRPETKVKSLLKKQGRDIGDFSEAYLDAVFYPTHKIRIPVNKEKVLASGLVKAKDEALILDYIDIDLPETGIMKSRLIMLDILANNDWERPIYFSGGSFDEDEYIWMEDYLQLDGLAYKLVPLKTKNDSFFDKGRIDSELMFNIVTGWEWGNSGSPDIYHDLQTRQQYGVTYRVVLARLLEKLLEEEKWDKAREIIDTAMTHIPVDYYGYYSLVEPFLEGYYKVGETQKARKLYHKLSLVYQDRLDHFLSDSFEGKNNTIEDAWTNVQSYKRLVDILVENKDSVFAKEQDLVLDRYLGRFQHFFGTPEER